MKKLKKLAMSATIMVALMVIISCVATLPTQSARADATITDRIYVTNWVGGPLGPGETWAGWKYQAAHKDGDKTIKWRPVILLPEGESRVVFRSKLTGNTVWEQHFRNTKHLVPNAPGKVNRSAPGTVRRFGQHVGVAPAPLATTTSSSLGPMLRLDGAKKKVDVIKSIFIKKGWCGNITSTIKKDDNYVGVFVDGVICTSSSSSFLLKNIHLFSRFVVVVVCVCFSTERRDTGMYDSQYKESLTDTTQSTVLKVTKKRSS